MIELLPCPLCGGEAEKLTSIDGFMSIGCLNCNHIFGVMIQRGTEAEAIAAWNSRAELGSEREAELQKALNKAAGNWAKADAELRNALDFMRIWISEDAHLGESAISREFEKAEGLRKLDAIEDAITGKLNSRAERTCKVEVRESAWGGFTRHCGVCDADLDCDTRNKQNYCPNCGAKVVGE